MMCPPTATVSPFVATTESAITKRELEEDGCFDAFWGSAQILWDRVWLHATVTNFPLFAGTGSLTEPASRGNE
jgi:hypothetical protein